MPTEREKQEARQHKREVKRAGARHNRRHLKQALVDAPEDAHTVDEDYGRHRSAGLNGFDRDPTRRRTPFEAPTLPDPDPPVEE